MIDSKFGNQTEFYHTKTINVQKSKCINNKKKKKKVKAKWMGLDTITIKKHN